MEIAHVGGTLAISRRFCDRNRSSEARLAGAEPRRAAHRLGLS